MADIEFCCAGVRTGPPPGGLPPGRSPSGESPPDRSPPPGGLARNDAAKAAASRAAFFCAALCPAPDLDDDLPFAIIKTKELITVVNYNIL